MALLCACLAWAAPAAHSQEADGLWLWGIPVAPPLIARAKTLYALQGEVYWARGQRMAQTITAQGVSIPTHKPTPTWLVYRTKTLQWSPRISQLMLARLGRWRAAGNQVLGIQIDFDANTAQLSQYGSFLMALRKSLPDDVRLSVTGLLDWTRNTDPQGISQLGAAVDEVVIQTYQGTTTTAHAATYLQHLNTLKVAFKVGVVQGGQPIGYRGFERNPLFRGYVLFPVKQTR